MFKLCFPADVRAPLVIWFRLLFSSGALPAIVKDNYVADAASCTADATSYTSRGHLYCAKYASYRRKGKLSLTQCKAACDSEQDQRCNAIGYSSSWSKVYCTTYSGCVLSEGTNWWSRRMHFYTKAAAQVVSKQDA